MQLTITSLEAAGVDTLPPDIVFDAFAGDFAVSTDPADGGPGGLVARNPIRTAVLMLLFTDVAVDPKDLRFEHRGDRRGWVGDGFDIRTELGEAPLGSRLWLYRREVLVSAVKQPTLMRIEADARLALQPLIRQGAAARIDVAGTADGPNGRISLSIGVYGRNGRQLYTEKFDTLWRRADGL